MLARSMILSRVTGSFCLSAPSHIGTQSARNECGAAKMKKQLESLRIACRNPSTRDKLALLLKERGSAAGVELKWGFRRVPLSRGRHHGGYVCAFRGQPLLRVESALERHVLRALAADPGC